MLIKKIQNILFLLLIASANSIQSAANGFDEYAPRPDVVFTFGQLSINGQFFHCAIENAYLSESQVNIINEYAALTHQQPNQHDIQNPIVQDNARKKAHKCALLRVQFAEIIAEHIKFRLKREKEFTFTDVPLEIPLVGRVTLSKY